MQERDQRLVDVARGLGRAATLEAMAERLAPALDLAPVPLAAGLSVLDGERGLATHRVVGPGPAASVTSACAEPAGGGEDVVVREVPAGADDPYARLLAERGAARVAEAVLRVGERTLGAVFLARGAGEAFSADERRYLADLARVVEPHVWSCFTAERFERGDRRRDALWELSRVINTSLVPRKVLDLARRAIGTIEGHRFSWIGLLEEDGSSWRRHDRPAEWEEGTVGEGARRRPLDAVDAFARVVGEERTYTSPDLEDELPFPGDGELLAAGVRRYVATPLCAGGKVLGALLFGSADPLAPLSVDLWLYENVALQIALALDNARHHEEILRLSARREQQNEYLREEIQSEHDFREMIGGSPAMLDVLERIERVAATDTTVLVTGPTGVGKELVARAVHQQSRAGDQPMVKLNCAAIPEGTVESELFGHERGAFTSAVERRIGRFELANNTTLFLDEIGELPLPVQAKLLNVLQSGEFERVGGTKTLRSNARIIAATNRDLSRAIEEGTFRADLFYRLAVFPIEVPPLDERREDVPLLVRSFAEQHGRRLGKRFEAIDPESLERLCARSWPGNVRELRHVVERAVILCDGPTLVFEDERPAASPGAREARAPKGLPTLEEMEAAHIRAALERTDGVVEGPRGAAALLGLKGSTLRFRMNRLGVRRP